MSNLFHTRGFDEGTKLKLEIFRGYIREWLPVFLTKSWYQNVHVFDFFAGPGVDIEGNLGSPLIILEELESFLREHQGLMSKAIRVTVHFNDQNAGHIEQLEERVGDGGADVLCEFEFSKRDFPAAFRQDLPILQSSDTANLVLLDQYGMKHVSQEVFCRLMECETTDILFFVSSTFLRRFSNDPSFQRYIPLDPEKIRSTDAKEVHRYVCECYRGLIPSNSEYYLAPFSIQKEGNRANIYGVIFGSHSLLGLEKFLKVCWDQDQTTGEANYNIDSDAIRDGQLSLFPEENVIKKCDKFEKDLVALLADGPCSNQRLYRFCLEGGFLPKHGNDILRKLQNDGKIEVRDASTGQGVRRGAFYLSWSHVGSDGRHVNIVYKG